jgi:hypothetical protein
VAEFIHFELKGDNDAPVHGVRYPSVARPGGVNVALFGGPDLHEAEVPRLVLEAYLRISGREGDSDLEPCRPLSVPGGDAMHARCTPITPVRRAHSTQIIRSITAEPRPYSLGIRA